MHRKSTIFAKEYVSLAALGYPPFTSSGSDISWRIIRKLRDKKLHAENVVYIGKMAPYMTHCDLCNFKFTTTRTFLRQRRSRNQNARPVKHLPFYKPGRIYHIPDPMGLLPNPTLTQEFKVWISRVVESINSRLYPKVSGMCFTSAYSSTDATNLFLYQLTRFLIAKVLQYFQLPN